MRPARPPTSSTAPSSTTSSGSRPTSSRTPRAFRKGDYDRLSQIAPTVAQSGDYIDFGMPWDEQTLLVGKALGREDEAERIVDDVKAKFAEAREAHPEWQGKTAILAYGGPDGYGAYATQDNRSRFLSDLGFKTPEAVDKLAGEASTSSSARSSSG